MSDFADKVAVVTGAATGLGAAFAFAFASRGATVVLLDRDADLLAETVGELRRTGYAAEPAHCDVADPGRVAECLGAVAESLGGIDILVNNAGLHSGRYNVPFGSLSPAERSRLFDVNVLGIVNCALAVREGMARRGGGAIVNIGSSAGYTCNNAYGVSKLAVRGVTMSLAHEFAGENIRCNAVAPGLVGTATNLRELPPELFDDYVQRLQLVRRPGTVDDVVSAVLFLCSPGASFMTGETMRVTGGLPLGI